MCARACVLGIITVSRLLLRVCVCVLGITTVFHLLLLAVFFVLSSSTVSFPKFMSPVYLLPLFVAVYGVMIA